MYIYLATNSINGKYYVGKTVMDIAKRWSVHCSVARKDSRSTLHNAIRKYGSECFTVEVLTTATSTEQLDQLERLWIIALRSYDRTIGYNMTMGGEGITGHKHSPETRARISKSHTGKNQSFETCQKISAAQAGNKYCVGRIMSEETRRKISEAHRRRKEREATLKGHKPIEVV